MEYTINGGAVLRFDPQDPKTRKQFAKAEAKIRAIEKQLTGKLNAVKKKSAQGAGEAAIDLMCRTDKRMKAVLNTAFGPGNDFDKLWDGVSLVAVASNGKRVVDNLLDMLQEQMNKYTQEE